MISTSLFEKYIKTIKSGYFKPAVKVEWLNPDETVNFEFTNALYDIDARVDVNKQSGCRRTCTVMLNNDNNKFPINFNNIWIGQKFKLWMGIYIDDETPYYFPQGVFYVSNPEEVYNPNTRTVTLNGVDKWAWLDGTLNGVLAGTHQTNINVNLYDATRSLLNKTNMGLSEVIAEKNIGKYFEVVNSTYYFQLTNANFKATNTANSTTQATVAQTVLKAKKDMCISFNYTAPVRSIDTFSCIIGGSYVVNVSTTYDSTQNITGSYSGEIKAGETLTLYYRKGQTYYYTNGGSASVYNMKISEIKPIDPIVPHLSAHYIGRKDSAGNEVLLCPYTATVERGRTYADILLEYATILCANVYYDANGRFTLEPMIDSADDITDTNKEVLWDYTVDEKTFLGLTQTFNFDKVYNDFIVLGNIVNGYQFKGRVQNWNPMSNTCIQRIGLKTKEPYEDNQYVSDEQCVELAKYYAKTDTIMQKSGNIPSVTLYHLDVDKLVTVSTPNNNMSKELFLITGFSLSASGQMSLNVSSVNILKDFSVAEAEVYA